MIRTAIEIEVPGIKGLLFYRRSPDQIDIRSPRAIPARPFRELRALY